MFFGLALPANATGNSDFIATIGGKGSGWSGVSLGGGMLNKLLIVAWPNAQAVVSSFRKTAYVCILQRLDLTIFFLFFC
jgi:acetyl-CoA carboxylase carboxyltransferase component